MMSRSWKLCSIVASLSMAVAAGSAFADGKMGTATVKGKISANGKPTPGAPIAMGADKYCADANAKPVTPQGKLVFSDGTLPYAFVYIKSADGKLDLGSKYTPPADAVEIDQQNCMYKPHVTGMVAGQTLKIVNTDNTNHNIHSLPTKNKSFNFSQPKKGMTKDLVSAETFNNPEVMVRVKCDVHPWMSAYIGVLPHPFFATTGKGGEFTIKNLPAGKYKLAVWHEEWAPQEIDIEVKDGETVEKDVTLAKK